MNKQSRVIYVHFHYIVLTTFRSTVKRAQVIWSSIAIIHTVLTIVAAVSLREGMSRFIGNTKTFFYVHYLLKLTNAIVF